MGKNNSEFHFYAKPYLLKLNFFPNGFVDPDDDLHGRSSGIGNAKYDPSEQTVTVPLLKQKIAGEESTANWPDLELTARMIQPREIPQKWLHSVVTNEGNGNAEGGDDKSDNDIDDEDIEIPVAQVNIKKVESSLPSLQLQNNNNTTSSASDGYGFDSIFRNVFADYCRSGLAEEMLQMRVCEPENSTMDDRRDERLEHELSNLHLERYLADGELTKDSQEDYLFPMVLAYEPWWRSTKIKGVGIGASLVQDLDKLVIGGDSCNKKDEKEISEDSNNSTTKTAQEAPSIFTNDEKLLLSTIPYPLLPDKYLTAKNGSYNSNASHEQTHALWCGLLELLFAYVYDHLATMGDPTVESAWTIFILSPGLSWLDSSSHSSVKAATETFWRRLLVYPYWRSGVLGRRVLSETLYLLETHGIRGATKALLQARKILDGSEKFYLGNKLWIDPYLYWIQQSSSSNNSGSSDTAGVGLDPIIQELRKILRNDKSFEAFEESVEISLDIPELLKEFFGSEDEDDDEAMSESESSDDSESDDDDESDTKDAQPASSIQLLDDVVGSSSGSKPFLRVSGKDSAPGRSLITEVEKSPSPRAEPKQRTLIEEL